MSRGVPFFLAVLLALNADARSGVLKTRDGRTFDGDVHLINGAVLIDSTNTVALTNLQRLTFDSEAAAYPGPPGRGLGLLGYYFGNTNSTGSVFVRLDETIDFNWGPAEPAPVVPKDMFSVTWMGEVEVPTNGNYTFHVAADDLGRLFLNDKLVVQSSGRVGTSDTRSEPIPLEAGRRHSLKLTCLEFSGTAGARLLWSGPGLPKSVIPKDRLYPKGFPPDHNADALSSQGLLATYYRNLGLSGETLTRVDSEINFNWHDRDPAAGFARTNFSVRWTGQLLADYSEDYTLHVMSDEPMRVWIDNRLLIIPTAQYFVTENKETVALLAGERYDIRVESQSTGATAMFKLMWSSASVPKAVIPSTHLFPSEPTKARTPSVNKIDRFPPGLVLRSGTFIAGAVERASETSVKAGGLLKSQPVSAVNVARIICQPMPAALSTRIPPGRGGLLLTKGDFVDTDFRSLEGDQVKVSSILMGARSYSATKDVMAVVLREATFNPGDYEIRLRDQSLIRAIDLAFEPTAVVVREGALGSLRVPAEEILQIQRAANTTK